MSPSLEILKLIHGTGRHCLEIIPEPSKDLKPWNSKFGGEPYFPKGTSWPLTSDGRPLSFLAQINFSEIPKIDPFPEKGLLQFYIIDNGIIKSEFNPVEFVEKTLNEPSNEYAFGVDPENPTYQNLFRVVFFSTVNELEPSQSPPVIRFSDEFPIREQHRLYFSWKIRYPAIYTLDYYQGFNTFLKNNNKKDEFEGYYNDCFSIDAFNHCIGGYPTFVQYDPRREYDFHHDKNILLLQIASKSSIEWIDRGVANFLISEDKLRKLDFSEVMYNMDFL